MQPIKMVTKISILNKGYDLNTIQAMYLIILSKL